MAPASTLLSRFTLIVNRLYLTRVHSYTLNRHIGLQAVHVRSARREPTRGHTAHHQPPSHPHGLMIPPRFPSVAPSASQRAPSRPAGSSWPRCTRRPRPPDFAYRACTRLDARVQCAARIWDLLCFRGPHLLAASSGVSPRRLRLPTCAPASTRMVATSVLHAQ